MPILGFMWVESRHMFYSMSGVFKSTVPQWASPCVLGSISLAAWLCQIYLVRTWNNSCIPSVEHLECFQFGDITDSCTCPLVHLRVHMAGTGLGVELLCPSIHTRSTSAENVSCFISRRWQHIRSVGEFRPLHIVVALHVGSLLNFSLSFGCVTGFSFGFSL